MLPASLIALNLNLQVCSINEFVGNVKLSHGRTRKLRQHISRPQDARHILLVDDSLFTGQSLQNARWLVEQAMSSLEITSCVIFSFSKSTDLSNIYFETVPLPRVFEWNIMHRPILSECCVDIDGVLCVDPSREQNDDGARYLDFLSSAESIVIPTHPIGHLVTSRLEKYRPQTEKWLADRGVEYRQLHMLDLPDAETRRRLRCHASFKARIFREQPDASLFIESEPVQALEIATASGKNVLCFSTQELFRPGVTYRRFASTSKSVIYRIGARVARAARRLGNRV
jgi:uncharacterized HAD superfamily protein